MSAKTVFISYRRDSAGSNFAAHLQSELRHRGYDVFLDVESLGAGRFSEQISREIETRTHFILAITPGALDRCSDEDDWVRREFNLAVRHKRNIIPVLDQSVERTFEQETASLTPVRPYQSHTIRHGHFEDDVRELVQRYLTLVRGSSSSERTRTKRPLFNAFKSPPPSRWRAATIGFIDYLRLKNSRADIFKEWPGLTEPLIKDFATPLYTKFTSRKQAALPSKRILIVNGPAGAGKTTYVDQLSRQMIGDGTDAKVDLFFKLKAGELEEAVLEGDHLALWQSIYSFFSKQAVKGKRPLTASAVAYALTKKKLLIIIEDLHWAVSTTAVLQFIESYFSHYHKDAWWKHVSVLATTRETSEKLSELKEQIETLPPLGQRDAQNFFWYLCQANAPELNLSEYGDALGRAFDAPSLQEPLFVVISASLVAHPSGSRLDVERVLKMNAPQLFDAFIEKLFRRSNLPEKINYKTFRDVYEDFALAAWPTLSFDDLAAERIVSDLPTFREHIDIRTLEANGFLRRDPLENLSFPHHAMGEFLTAAAMVRHSEFGKLTDNDQEERVSGLIPFIAALIKPPIATALENLAKANLWMLIEVLEQHTAASSRGEVMAWKVPANAIAKLAGESAKSKHSRPLNRESWEKLRGILDGAGVTAWRTEFCAAASGADGPIGTDVEALAIMVGDAARYALQDRLKTTHGPAAFSYAIKTVEVQNFLLSLVETAGLRGELGRRSFAVLTGSQENGVQRSLTQRVAKNFNELKAEDLEELLQLGRDAQRTLGYACSNRSQSEKRLLCASAARSVKRLLVPPGEYEISDQCGRTTVSVKKPTLITSQPERAGHHTLSQVQKYLARKVKTKNLLTRSLALVLQQHFEHILNELFGPRFANSERGEYEALLHDGKIGLFYFFKDEIGRMRIGSLPQTAVQRGCEVVYHTIDEL